MKLKILLFSLSALVTAVLVTACGDDETTATDTSYQGPGSVWDSTLKADGTFTLTRKADVDAEVNLTINGTYETLASGFIKMTVTDASGTNAPSAGDKAYALNVSGLALLVKPVGDSSSEIIPMVATGSCPTEDFTSNWVQINQQNGTTANDTSRDWFGTFVFDVSEASGTLPTRFSLEGFTSQGAGTIDNSTSATCSNGRLEIGGGSDGGILWLTPSGAAIVTTLSSGSNDGSIMAMPATEITQANMDGTYAGLAYTNDDGNFPIQITIANSGTTGTGKAFDSTDDIDNNTPSSSEAVTLAFNTANQVGSTSQPGMMTGTITSGSNPASEIACMALENAASSGDNLIFCIGQDPGDNTDMFSLIGVEVN